MSPLSGYIKIWSIGKNSWAIILKSVLFWRWKKLNLTNPETKQKQPKFKKMLSWDEIKKKKILKKFSHSISRAHFENEFTCEFDPHWVDLLFPKVNTHTCTSLDILVHTSQISPSWNLTQLSFSTHNITYLCTYEDENDLSLLRKDCTNKSWLVTLSFYLFSSPLVWHKVKILQ